MRGLNRHRGLTARVAMAGVIYIVGLVFVFAVLANAISDLRAETDARRDANAIRISTDRLLRSVLDLETGVRAFLITGERRFLEPWEAGRRRLPVERRRFDRLIASRLDTPTVPESLLRRLRDRLDSYVPEYSLPLVRHAEEHAVGAHRLRSDVAEGKLRVDEIRDLIGRIQRAEAQRAAREDREARGAARRALITALAGLLLLASMVAATVVYLARTVTRPISRVALKAQALSAGRYEEDRERLPRRTAREVRTLTESFDVMAEAIHDHTTRLEGHNALLERRVRERTQDLEQARYEALGMLAIAAEYRDDDTQRHTQRVGRNAALIAERLGLGDATVALIRSAAPLHDVGKIGVPDSILLKPGRLTPDEYEAMKQHVDIGMQILGASQEPLFHVAAQIAYTHHERWDGTGYPAGLAGEAIPLAGRIVAVVDVFDALTHERPYKDAWPVDEALAEIRRGAGSQFDPAVVQAFEAMDPDAFIADSEDEPQLAG